ncbi:MAG: hypothetical protein F9K25_18605 [Candidatus Contendobacter sp.]|nr:MAG: hypothetical protein F9K25_18605 [Candidatus Contendobacter sp.]
MNHCPHPGNLSYPTAAEAWTVLRIRGGHLALATRKNKRKNGSVYRCEHCHQWHTSRQADRHAPSHWPQRRHAALEREPEARK